MRSRLEIRRPVLSGVSAAVLSLCLFGCEGRRAEHVPSFDKGFWDQWSDGAAEMASYALTYPRYGQPREGTAVTIFIPEKLSRQYRVKADPGNHAPSEEIYAVKLNLVQDFPTGVYDYNLMTTAFVSMEPWQGRSAGSPIKVAFSSQEWCGLRHAQLQFDRSQVRSTSHSYFDGEADQQNTARYLRPGFSEDMLLLWARGWAWPRLEPGASMEVKVLRSAEAMSLGHQAMAWSPGTLSRSKDVSSVDVPAGTFEVEKATLTIGDAVTWDVYVEQGAPRRIIRWTSSQGHDARLIESARMKYWEMKGPGDIAQLSKLGLADEATAESAEGDSVE